MHPIRQLIQLIESAIAEAPVHDIDLRNMDQPGSFSDVDRRLLSNPAHIEKIRRRFEKTPFIFNLAFVNLPGKSFVSKQTRPWGDEVDFSAEWQNLAEKHQGITTPQALKSLFGVDVNVDHNAINVVYISNASIDDTIPLTPWIVAHRFAHALLDRYDVRPSDVSTLIHEYLKVAETVNQRDMTMRSARTNTLIGREYRVEFVTQYLMTGAVTLSSGSQLSDKPEFEALYREKVLDPVQAHLNELIKAILDRCVGKLFLAV